MWMRWSLSAASSIASTSIKHGMRAPATRLITVPSVTCCGVFAPSPTWRYNVEDRCHRIAQRMQLEYVEIRPLLQRIGTLAT